MKTIIKENGALNDMLNELEKLCDWAYVNELLNDASYYTVADKTYPEEVAREISKLTIKAIEQKKPIYEVFSEDGWAAYFLGELK